MSKVDDKGLSPPAWPTRVEQGPGKPGAPDLISGEPVPPGVAKALGLARHGTHFHSDPIAEEIRSRMPALDGGGKRPAPLPVSKAGLGFETRPQLDAEVIVVGAGISGLTAAGALGRSGVKTLVLEAQDHIGGRIRDDKGFSIPVSLGASWLHSSWDEDGKLLNPLAKKALKAGIALHESKLDVNLLIDGQPAPPAEVAKYQATLEKFDEVIGQAAEAGKDVAAGSLLPKGLPYAQAAAADLGELDMAVNLDKVSSLETGGQVMTGRDALPEGGMERVLNELVADVPVRTSTPVTKVKWGPQGVEVTTREGEVLHAKRVLLTVSTGVLASGRIAFDPPLPDWKRDAVKALPMGAFEKVVVEFDTNVFTYRSNGQPQGENEWVVNASSDGSAPMAFLMRPQGANLVIGFAGGDEALKLHADPQRALEHTKDKLRQAFGPSIDQHIRRTAVTQWAQNPYTLGSYSYAKPGMAKMREKLAQPVDSRLYFAGEGATPIQDSQMVHGAWASGLKAAKALVAEHHVELRQQKLEAHRRARHATRQVHRPSAVSHARVD